MKAKDYIAYIVNEIHSTIVATVDDDGLPVTCAIDMMDCDADRNEGRGYHVLRSCICAGQGA